MTDQEEKRIIEVNQNLSVGELASFLEIPATTLIGELFKNGITTTINQKIDSDTAQIIIDELGLNIKIVQKDSSIKLNEKEEDSVDEGINQEDRPPVIAVMGHVDHGKTSLLDAILDLKVVSGEAGGITQHISAYQKEYKGRKITFLDTPGHEAFSALRQHGAALTDLAIIVVAADDGVKPQTLEAIRFAKEEKVKILIAATKIDKPEADLAKLKQQLVDAGVTPEEWGGDTTIVEVSAKTKQGIDQLLDMALLIADLEDLKASTDTSAKGLVIEAHQEKGMGPLVKVLITSGTLNVGQGIAVGGSYGKVRTLRTWDGKEIDSAGPSTPVQISGLKSLPNFGDRLKYIESEKEARRLAKGKTSSHNELNMSSDELLRVMTHRNEITTLPIILKADVAGSLKSVSDSIQLVGTDEVEAKLIGSGVGNITEKDIMLAASSKAIIYGFNAELSHNVNKVAQNNNIKVRTYDVIYELIDDVKAELSKLIKPEIIDTDMGRLIVKGVFHTTPTEIVCGGDLTKGTLSPGFRAKLYRNDLELQDDLEVDSVQQGQQELKEVIATATCGLKLKVSGKVKILEEDRLEFYKRDVIEKTL